MRLRLAALIILFYDWGSAHAAMDQVGVLWQMHSDVQFSRDVDEFTKTFQALQIQSQPPLSPDISLSQFGAAVSRALESSSSNEGAELFVHLSSHGCVGSVSCSGGKTLAHVDLLKELTNRIANYKNTSRKKVTVNLLCDMCHSGSWKESIQKISGEHPFHYNLLTSSATQEYGYSSQFLRQFMDAQDFLNRMGPDAEKFCPGCTRFEKAAKLLSTVHFSNIITPQAVSSKRDFLTLTDGELATLLKHSDNRTFNAIYAHVEEKIQTAPLSEGAQELRRALSNLRNSPNPGIQTKARLKVALLENQTDEMIETIMSPDFGKHFVSEPYPDEIQISEATNFRMSPNRNRFQNSTEATNEVRKIVRERFLKNPEAYDTLQFNPKTIAFFSEDLDQIVKRFDRDPLRLKELFSGIKSYFQEAPSGSGSDLAQAVTALRRVPEGTSVEGLRISDWATDQQRTLFNTNFPAFMKLYDTQLNTLIERGEVGPIYDSFTNYLKMADESQLLRNPSLRTHRADVLRKVVDHIISKNDTSDAAIKTIEAAIEGHGKLALPETWVTYIEEIPRKKLSTFHIETLILNLRLKSLRYRFDDDPNMLRAIHENLDRILEDPKSYKSRNIFALITAYEDLSKTPWASDPGYLKTMNKFKTNGYPMFTDAMLDSAMHSNPLFLRSHPQVMTYLRELSAKPQAVEAFLERSKCSRFYSLFR